MERRVAVSLPDGDALSNPTSDAVELAFQHVTTAIAFIHPDGRAREVHPAQSRLP